MSSASFITMMQESLHCVSFAISQIKGSKINEMDLMDANMFMRAYQVHCITNATNGQTLYDWMKNNPSWTDSVILNTNVFFASPYNKKKYKFYRGAGLMNDIYAQFSRLASAEGIKLHPDKWNPGDVWAFSSGAKVVYHDSLAEFNMFISNSLKNGNILPISLKKSAGFPKVEYVNQWDSRKKAKIYSYKGVRKPQSPFNTGISILTSDPQLTLNVRSFSISSEAFPVAEIQLKGTGARHGKSRIDGHIKKYNIYLTSKSDVLKHIKDKNYLKNQILMNWKDLGHVFAKPAIENAWSKLNPKYRDGSQSVGYYLSILNSQEFALGIQKNKGYADIIINDIVNIGSSHSDYSSDFIKIY